MKHWTFRNIFAIAHEITKEVQSLSNPIRGQNIAVISNIWFGKIWSLFEAIVWILKHENGHDTELMILISLFLICWLHTVLVFMAHSTVSIQRMCIVYIVHHSYNSMKYIRTWKSRKNIRNGAREVKQKEKEKKNQTLNIRHISFIGYHCIILILKYLWMGLPHTLLFQYLRTFVWLLSITITWMNFDETTRPKICRYMYGV